MRDIADPRQRLTALLTTALGHEDISGLESAVVAHADHPAVAPVLRRVTGRRIAYLTQLYTDLGMEPAPARRQAVIAYAAYLGMAGTPPHVLRHRARDRRHRRHRQRCAGAPHHRIGLPIGEGNFPFAPQDTSARPRRSRGPEPAVACRG